MADGQSSGIVSRGRALWMALVGAIAAGALVPHLSPAQLPTLIERTPPGAQGGSAASAPPALDDDRVTTAIDLLAAHFGVDVTTGGTLQQLVEPRAADRAPSGASPKLTPFEIVESKAGGAAVQFVIATVPDPIDSYETWQFDPYLDAIRQGIEASGYLLDRFYLPDAEIERKATADAPRRRRDLHEHYPGVILFRWKNEDIPRPGFDPAANSAPPEPLLVLFLVPETPVAGIHQEPFVRAVELATRWMSRHRATSDGRLRILGPSFSGSRPSIVRALSDKPLRDLIQDRLGAVDVTMVTGSASSDSNREEFEHVPGVTFRSTMQSNSAVTDASTRYLSAAGIVGRTAYLAEGSTAFGTDVAKVHTEEKNKAGTNGSTDVSTQEANKITEPKYGKLTIKFPFNIAKLRNDASQEDTSSARRSPLADVLPALRPLLLEDKTTPTDQFPLQTPSTSASYVELVLTSLIDAIRHEEVRIVNIDATDVRDKLYLVKEIRQRAPDVLITTTDTDLFQVHPDQARWMKGLIVTSTYPLHVSSQTFVYPYRPYRSSVLRPNGDLVQFPGSNMQGLYNAALALLNYDVATGQPQERFDERLAALPRLIDYGGLGDACTAAAGAFDIRRPAVWISIVGNDEIVPLKSDCDLSPKQAGYVFQPKLPPADPPQSVHDVSMSPLAQVLVTLLLCGTAALCRLAWRRRSNAGTTGAMALALSGPMIPLAFLTVTVTALARQAAAGDDWLVAATMAGITALCILELAVAACFQLDAGTRMVAGRAAVVAAAAATSVYGYAHLGQESLLFLQRTFDIDTMTSPLLAITTFGMVPVLPAVVELWRRRSFGRGSTDAADAPARWVACLDSVCAAADLKVDAFRAQLGSVHRSMFAASGLWLFVPLISTALAMFIVFGAETHPILSIEGTLFGWGLVLFVSGLQWCYAAAIAHFVYVAHTTGRFLLQAGAQSTALPYDAVPRELSPIGLIPRAPALRQLAAMARLVPHGTEELQKDLHARPQPRWFQSNSWDLVRRELETPRPLSAPAVVPVAVGPAFEFAVVAALDPLASSPGPAAMVDDGQHRGTLVATGVVLVVRELLSALGGSLILVGPAMMLLITLYATVYFDQSHCLLGLVWTDVLVAIVIVMAVFVWMDRNDVISRIRHSTPGEIDWNWDFVLKGLVYVALPLLTLFATQFPNIGSGLMQLLEPVQRLP